jgi:hypothetical protein
VRGGNI